MCRASSPGINSCGVDTVVNHLDTVRSNAFVVDQLLIHKAANYRRPIGSV